MKIVHLVTTSTEQYPMREDVFAFACVMSTIMQAKEIEDKRDPTFITALQEIEAQMSRLKEQIEHGGGVSSDFPSVYRRLTHIANFAMIAYGKVKTQ